MSQPKNKKTSFDSSNSSTETQLQLIKSEVNSILSVIDKFDLAINKLNDISNNINRVIDVQDEKLEHHKEKQEKLEEKLEVIRKSTTTQHDFLHDRINKTKKEMYDDMNKKHDEIMKEMKNQGEKSESYFNQLSKRIDNLEKWKWYITGAIAAGITIASLLINYNVI